MENVVEVEKDLKVQERVSRWNCDSQTTPGHQCELESDKIEVEQNFSLMPEGCTVINETGVRCLLRQGTVQTGDEDCAAV